MRFISCQYEEYFKNGLWKKNASHSNKMAKYLYKEFAKIDGVTFACKTVCNSVFVTLPKEIKNKISKEYYFYDMDMEAVFF